MSDKNVFKFLDSPEAKEFSESFRKKDLEMRKGFEENPDNGTSGWWLVSGLRHSAIVRGSSAPEAAEKADKALAVGDWELLEVFFMGEELPDVVRV